MSIHFDIKFENFRTFKNSDEVLFKAVEKAMTDIKDDIVDTSSSLAPHKTGKLEKSHIVKKTVIPLHRVSFEIAYRAFNKGFNYAWWTHEEKYNLGLGSQQKQQQYHKKGKFSNKVFRVGRYYLDNATDGVEQNGGKYIEKEMKKSVAEYFAKGRD
jgi:hypothetical protein